MRTKWQLYLALILAPMLMFAAIWLLTQNMMPDPYVPIASTPNPLKIEEPKVFDAHDYGPNCTIKNTCNNLVEVDCLSAADGPLYYIDVSENKVLQTCGGACMVDNDEPGICEECPPNEWEVCLKNK